MKGEPRAVSMTSSTELPDSQLSSSMITSESEAEELQRKPLASQQMKNKKFLSKQLSMCETSRNIAWERRRRQCLCQERRRDGMMEAEELTDDDLRELKGCIELGFGFNEEARQSLCGTLPALDLYFAVNRQLPPSPVSSPQWRAESTASLGDQSSSVDSPKNDSDWKICSPGDDPRQVKAKLRHWAQAVACSVMQLC